MKQGQLDSYISFIALATAIGFTVFMTLLSGGCTVVYNTERPVVSPGDASANTVHQSSIGKTPIIPWWVEE